MKQNIAIKPAIMRRIITLGTSKCPIAASVIKVPGGTKANGINTTANSHKPSKITAIDLRHILRGSNVVTEKILLANFVIHPRIFV